MIAVGVIAIVVGALSGLLALFGAGMVLSRVAVGATTSVAAGIAPLAVYVGGSVSLIWLGIGSVLARRWARALMLVFSWLWLLSIALTAITAVSMYAAGQMGTIGHAEKILMGVTLMVVVVFFFGMPLAFILYYGRADVRAAFEALDPKVRWTDRAPLPLLGTSFFLLGIAALLALMAASGDLPLGHLNGSSASVGYLMIIALVLACAFGFYKKMQVTWWIVTAGFAFVLVSAGTEIWRSDARWALAVEAAVGVAGGLFLASIRRWFKTA